ncbi:hypothetical protein VTI74DRAFT_5198 [Chaetomium olivicolor]
MADLEHPPSAARNDTSTSKPPSSENKDATGLSSDSSNSHHGSDEPIPHLHAKTFLAVFAVCLIYFAQLVSIVGAGVQGQTIGAHFNDTGKVVWFPGAIGIFTVVLGPIVSQAADYWGRKWFLVILTLLGGVGSCIVSRASSINMAVAGFCIIGLAFGTQPLLHVVTAEILPRRWRGWAQACPSISITLGSLLGLFVGAALNRNSNPTADGFRYYYYMTMGCFLLAAIICLVAYNPPPLPTQTQLTQAEKLAKLDWIGFFLFSSGLVLFSVGLSYSKNPYPWCDARVSATFATGIALSLALGAYETWIKRDGLFHHGLFSRNRNFPISLFCISLEGLSFFAVNSYFSFQVSVFYEQDAMLVAVRYSFKFIFTALVSCVTAWYCARYRRVRWSSVVGFAILMAFFVCMATAGRGADHEVWGYAVLMGLSTPPELLSIASGLFISLRSLGGVVGLAIYNSVFNAEMSYVAEKVGDAVTGEGLAPENAGAFVAALMKHNETGLAGIPGVTPGIIESGVDALMETYTVAFRNVWITAGCFVAVAAIAAAFLVEEKNQFNMRIDNPIEKEEKLYSA